MNYREWSPPSALSPWVACLWTLQAPADESPRALYPDGRCELIWHRAAPPQIQGADGQWQTQGRLLFAGQGRQALRLWAREPMDCIGLRLQPAASAALGDYGAERLQAARDQVLNLPDTASGWQAILAQQDWTRLREQLQPLDAAIVQACELLDGQDGVGPVAGLAQQLGLSLRSLQLRFARAVGLSPKEYARIRRLQATLRLLDESAHSLADTAHQAGYADQAHAHRDLRDFTGLTPARLRRALQAAREGDQTLALAAAFVRGR
ncbi:AraC-like DNA-binding protein [Inhella inkyongensis]|uniref:AraC-like DNA-binding protein n=1 Tax=Inhella inkyongensis TaxID=392593 RepID=A0A840S7M5_9BURK|nr:helix-turn-helix domain-containing protein [Inhella inkyongensis]MBB5205602.1 AraC-like DNA-binding protein [Inhella inkyongensis]